jgi:Domain of unknown function (DUF4864)
MPRIVRQLAALLMLLAPLLPAIANADDLSAADRAAMQAVISGQIGAFQHDDGSTAYGFASPNIQTYYPTADLFMAMVKNGYPAIYRPQSVTFGEALDTDAGPVQKVFIKGSDGQAYIALYAFQHQPDGTWKINGVTVLKDDSPSI